MVENTTKSDLRARVGEQEWAARVQLAACYRIFDYLGWVELIYNHITIKVPGADNHFLINPYGLLYKEIRASNLVKIDLRGELVEDSEWPVNPAGFVIHSAIHATRPDVHCVAHTHTTAGMSVACQKEGLRSDNFYSCILRGRIAYHDFEGITVNPGEKERLVTSLGEKNHIILRNHGLLTCGPTVAATFHAMWLLQRACEIQLATDQSGRASQPISGEVATASAERLKVMAMDKKSGELEFAAMVREIEHIDPSYKT